MNRIIIFANGDLTHPNQIKQFIRPTDHIVCADGGTIHCLKLGITPNLVIGDLDSTPPHIIEQLMNQQIAIQQYPTDKDKTDLALALDWAVEQHPQEVVLLTALGGRLDQMLANIMLLTQHNYTMVPVMLFDGNQTIRLLQAGQAVTIPGQPGDTLSLIPLTTVRGLTLTNVQWPLHKATTTLGSSLTISNTMLTTQATVEFDEGLMLVVKITSLNE